MRTFEENSSKEEFQPFRCDRVSPRRPSKKSDAAASSSPSSAEPAGEHLAASDLAAGLVPDDALQVGDLQITAEYLQTESAFLDSVTIQLYQKLVERYGEELDQEITSDTILTNIKNMAEAWLAEQAVWPQLAQDIRSNLVMRSLQEMERDLGDSVLQSLDWEAFNRLLLQYLGKGDRQHFKTRLTQLEAFHSQRLAEQIVQSLQLDQQPFSALKRMLNLHSEVAQRIPTMAEPEQPSVGPITQIPSEFPVSTQEDAEGVLHFSDRQQADLWETDIRNVGFLRYQSRHNRNFFLEHSLSNPSDLPFLPWEMSEQLLQKCGLQAAQLHFLLTAYAAQQRHPWCDTMRLDLDALLHTLKTDFDPRMGMSIQRNQLASLAYALSCLLVKIVWDHSQPHSSGPAETPVGKLWDILIEPSGTLDWSTGRIEQPDSVRLIVRPGLWIDSLDERADSRIFPILNQFGQVAQALLKYQAFANELALRLLVFLMLDSRLQATAPHPHEYDVRQLLSICCAEDEAPLERLNLSRAQTLFEEWHQLLEILAHLGWQPQAHSGIQAQAIAPIEFYRSPYPRWLDPNRNIRKPKGWVANWLDQTLVLCPPWDAIAPLSASSLT